MIQKHDASRLHYDFRLQLNGVLLSWAVPKGPSLDPTVKRMAIQVEDHPLSYGSFEGTIPAGEYGAGHVLVWDAGFWAPQGDPVKGLADGKLIFRLQGQKLAGVWELIRTARPGDRQQAWLLFKKKDTFARPTAEFDVVKAMPDRIQASALAAAMAPEPDRPSAPARKAGKARVSGKPGPPGAVKARAPAAFKPQLATPATQLPATGEWLYEIKFDGYRLLTHFEKGRPRLLTRSGLDWSAKMPALVAELRKLGVRSGWLDGEIVVLGKDGRPSFNALQKAFESAPTRRAGPRDEIVYFLFDLPFLEGFDLRDCTLLDRRRVLESVLHDNPGTSLRLSDAFAADGGSVLDSACRIGLEGIIAKRTDAPYVSRRADTWLKIKCAMRQEFVIAGYTLRANASSQVGSLLLGVHGKDGELVSVGRVGTGWSTEDATGLLQQLSPLQRGSMPFAASPPASGRWVRRKRGDEHWVEPTRVAEISFSDWTPDGQIRHATFVALRADIAAADVVREPTAVAARAPVSRSEAMDESKTGTQVNVTHADRVIDTSSKVTKIDLIHYYESVAEWMLPHLKGRPCALLRAPEGVAEKQFFQRHGDRVPIPGVRTLDPALWPEHEALLEVATLKGLIGAAQMNTIEFHTWNSKAKAIDKPDRLVFDLDPGEGVGWPQVREAATLLRDFLQELSLEAWLKTSGGKGLHVVVPLAARRDSASLKAFTKQVVEHMARVIPSRFVAISGPSRRVGKIFIDYLRNGHGATTVAAYSARARPGLGVSMPIDWDELGELKRADQWTVRTARDRLSFQKADPWQDYWQTRQTITAALKRLD